MSSLDVSIQSYDSVKDFPQIECFGEIFTTIQFNSWIISWTFCIRTFKLYHVAKYLPHWSQLNFYFHTAALICNFSPVFCVKFLPQWSQLNSTICINTFKMHPIVKFLPHWSQLNLFFHEQQYYVPSIQYCVWNFFKCFMDIFHMHFFFPMISFLQFLHLNSQSANHVHMHEVW